MALLKQHQHKVTVWDIHNILLVKTSQAMFCTKKYVNSNVQKRLLLAIDSINQLLFKIQVLRCLQKQVILSYTVNGKKLEGLWFGQFGKLCCLHQTLFANCTNQSNIHTYVVAILDEFTNFLPPNRFIGRFAKL